MPELSPLEKSQLEIKKIRNDFVGHDFRHFKGTIYHVIDLAVHSESCEIMVLYVNNKDKSKVWCRPFSLFTSEVDRQKYPDVKQKMRFERVVPVCPKMPSAYNALKIFDESSPEYKQLDYIASKLNKEQDDVLFHVETVYFDMGLDWKYTTIIAEKKNISKPGEISSWQIFSPNQQAVALYGTDAQRDTLITYMLTNL